MTPLEVSAALLKLGFTSVQAFQAAHPPLVVDGIVGPKTTAALVLALGALEIPPPAYLRKQSPVTRSEAGDRAYDLNEPDMPRVLAPVSDFEKRNAELLAIVDWCDVEHSPRWLPWHDDKGFHTLCNVYAHDVCTLAGVYLPHVFWKAPAIAQKNYTVKYDVTVNELSANALYDWLGAWGSRYGWTRHAQPDTAQAAVNTGCIGVVCAAHKIATKAGHVSVIVPESPRMLARRKNGSIIAPVQSQAGATNKKLFSGAAWWLSANYRGWGMWTHA